ncbi:hypothetical protein [Magnetospirillum aberrantis]|uniref:Uncharacterized protein n=1 Tax=Magnetospirillum aberrantis SpK TaxID=908842 RepID=A0A7C9QU15_9PROT|nr:hypothetical protein [Magnetospirillum aberrantis]NFV80525.1 hypothetical protein [Magnetospirillum aberrantis SpK]
MRLSMLVLSLILAMPAVASAQENQAPINLLPQNQHDAVPPADKPLLEEPSPNFQAIRPNGTEVMPGVPAVQQQPLPVVEQAVPAPQPTAPMVQQLQPPAAPPPPVAAAPVTLPAPVATAPVTLPAPPPAMVPPPSNDQLPPWLLPVLVLAGAFLATLFGILTALSMRRAEIGARRRAVAATLATELETRRQAYEAVPLPPNVEAGVSFVSAVTSLAGFDAGFRSTQGALHLLPEKLAAHVSVHYAAVQRVSDFVKGQSLAAAVRMLQANRLGGHPCPDAGTMREAHTELGAAFRGLDKLVQTLRSLS